MVWKEGEYWLRDAVKYVKFPPDRRRVQQELYEHMISRNRDFLDMGYSEEEADRRVCEAMGDPDEVGKALAEVHKPFWGYFLRVLRILLILAALFTAVVAVKERAGSLADNAYFLAHRAAIDARIDRWIPQKAAESAGDYRFRLQKAGFVPRSEEGSISFRYAGIDVVSGEGPYLELDLLAFTWDPFLGSPRFDFWALTVEDSKGRVYRASAMSRDLIFVSQMRLTVYDFDPAAEWAVLHMQAGDRKLRFPIRLKGGGA